MPPSHKWQQRACAPYTLARCAGKPNPNTSCCLLYLRQLTLLSHAWNNMVNKYGSFFTHVVRKKVLNFQLKWLSLPQYVLEAHVYTKSMQSIFCVSEGLRPNLDIKLFLLRRLWSVHGKEHVWARLCSMLFPDKETVTLRNYSQSHCESSQLEPQDKQTLNILQTHRKTRIQVAYTHTHTRFCTRTELPLSPPHKAATCLTGHWTHMIQPPVSLEARLQPV